MDVPAPANRPFPNLVMPHHVSGWKDGLIRFEIAKALHNKEIVPQGDVTVRWALTSLTVLPSY
jgi:hypothetical protein